jgi:hypothetical protein
VLEGWLLAKLEGWLLAWLSRQQVSVDGFQLG